MKNTTPVRLLFLFGAVCLTCAAKPPPQPPVIALGENTYSVTREASNTFQRDIEKFKAEARKEAEQFCAAQGKQMKEVSLVTEKPWMTTGFLKATLVFKALTPGEPEPTPAATPVATVLSAAPSGPDDFYTALLKLDDLHKKGIISDKEFETQKKKILKRAN